jgi:RNA recognition motif-containing protein
VNIYVGNLAYSVTDDDLRELFNEFGEVRSASVISDKVTGQSKGFGFVEMQDNSAADMAVKELNGRQVKGRALKVNEAKPREDRPPQRRPRY